MTETIENSSAALLTVPEVAQFARVSPASIYRLINRGEIPAVRIGGSLRVRRADLFEYLFGDSPAPPEIAA